MASWWRRFAEEIGVPPTTAGKSWRVRAILRLSLDDETLSSGSGGLDRRIVYYMNRMQGTGPWARHLLHGSSENPNVPGDVENGVIHQGNPVYYGNMRVVHNG